MNNILNFEKNNFNWSSLKDGSDVICLDSNMSIYFKHSILDNLVKVSWWEQYRTLEITQVTIDNFKIEDQEIFDLTKFNFLLLNPDHEGLQRLLDLSVNSETKELVLKIHENIKFNILDFKIINYPPV